MPVAIARERVRLLNKRVGPSEKYALVRENYNTLTQKRLCEDIAGFKIGPLQVRL